MHSLVFIKQVPDAAEIKDVDKKTNKIKVSRVVDGGMETVEVPMPCLITAEETINSIH